MQRAETVDRGAEELGRLPFLRARVSRTLTFHSVCSCRSHVCTVRCIPSHSASSLRRMYAPIYCRAWMISARGVRRTTRLREMEWGRGSGQIKRSRDGPLSRKRANSAEIADFSADFGCRGNVGTKLFGLDRSFWGFLYLVESVEQRTNDSSRFNFTSLSIGDILSWNLTDEASWKAEITV